MPRWMRCTVEELSVLVRAAEYAERIGDGKVVDFDRVILPATAAAPAVTLEQVLGHRAATCFEPVTDQRVATHYVGLPADDDVDTDTPAIPAQE